MGPLEEEFGKKGVAFLLVNAFEDPAAGRAFAAKEGWKAPVAFADDAALRALGVRAAPSQILVAADGTVAWTSSFSTMMEGIPALRRALEDVTGGGAR